MYFLEHLFQSSPDNSVDGPEPTHRTVIGHSSVRDGHIPKSSKPTGADTQPNAGCTEYVADFSLIRSTKLRRFKR